MKQISFEKKYSPRRCFQAVLRQNFPAFFQKVFYNLNPGKKIENNWHITYLASLLQEVYEGKHKNLIICVPPRSLKSTLITVAWTAWLLGKDPTKRILAASYSLSLSTKLSMDTRNIINSDWYREIFPNMRICKDQNSKTKFVTNQHGFRFATSVGGTTIGEGGDVLIVDDPLSPIQANSKKMRERAISWFNESFSTRLNDKKNGVKVIVMQRLHADDLVGRIAKEMAGDWKLVNISAIADNDQKYITEKFSYFRKKGEYLHEEREGRKELDMMKRQLGSYAFSAQYQQVPVSDDGGIIKKEWIKRYEVLPASPSFIVQSWDLAFTNKSYSDFSVCTTWYVFENNYYLADVYRVQKEFPELIIDAENNYRKWNAQIMVVEDTVASKAFIQEMRKKGKYHVISSRPVKDKYTRMALCSPNFESGKIYLPNRADWLVEFVNEIVNFPQTPHDDQVDSMTQFISYAEHKLCYANKSSFLSGL